MNKDNPDKGLIQSVIIKRDSNNDLNKNKNVDQVFKDEKGEDDANTKYYACKVDGSSFKNPDLSGMQLLTITDNTGVDDLYNHIKTNGGMSDKSGEKDGIQLFKVTGNIDQFIDKDLLDNYNNIYDLIGTINHIGEINIGHYYSLIRLENDNHFYKFDDSTVTRVDEDFSNAYILFYLKRENINSRDFSKESIITKEINIVNDESYFNSTFLNDLKDEEKIKINYNFDKEV